MPPSNLLSPSELAYLHTSLSLDPPIRPDARAPTSFRPLVAEVDLLPTTNGSARLCFADGTEAIVGVKAEVERTLGIKNAADQSQHHGTARDEDVKMQHSGEVDGAQERRQQAKGKGQDSWIEVSVDMPGFGRDDDGIVVFLGQMLQEGLVADGGLRDRLWIGWGWHWRIYVDLPAPISRIDEDPLFNDDWDAAEPLYASDTGSRPPFTLLMISVGDNIFFDPAREELAVADAVCAVTVGTIGASRSTSKTGDDKAALRLLSLRTIDPPARLAAAASTTDDEDDQGVWRPARGGMKRSIVGRLVKMVLEPEGVGEEVMKGLKSFSEVPIGLARRGTSITAGHFRFIGPRLVTRPLCRESILPVSGKSGEGSREIGQEMDVAIALANQRLHTPPTLGDAAWGGCTMKNIATCSVRYERHRPIEGKAAV
ncbi:MAG: hypothetical protein Q9203_002670 [Teloschistes exilis]